MTISLTWNINFNVFYSFVVRFMCKNVLTVISEELSSSTRVCIGQDLYLQKFLQTGGSLVSFRITKAKDDHWYSLLQQHNCDKKYLFERLKLLIRVKSRFNV